MRSAYVIAIIAGVAIGFIVSRGWRPAAELAGAGVCFIVLAAAIAMLTSYEGPDIADLLILSVNPLKDNWGLIQLAVVGYTCIIGAFVVALRTAVARGDARANNSVDI